MRSMKQKLLIPLLCVIVLTPLVTIGIYNVMLIRYFDQSVRQQLLHSVETSRSLVKQELSRIVYESDPDSIENSLIDLNRVLGNTITTLNLELALFTAAGDCIYMTEKEPGLIQEDLIRQISLRLNDLRTTDVLIFHSGNQRIAAAGYRLTELPLSDIPYVVFASSMDVAKPILFQANLILVTIMVIGVTIGILMVVSVSNKVIRPVRQLYKGAQDISERKTFVPVTECDVLEMVQLSDQMVEMDKRLKEYDQAQKSFLQDASHELKTPLMSIQGYAEGIEKGLFPDTREAGAVISKESRRLGGILKELLTLSRIDNLNYALELESVELQEVLRDSVQHLSGIALKSGKEIILKEVRERIPVHYNEELFYQCLGNIVDNAIRYAKKTIRITVSTDHESARIRVEDDGDGIKEEEISMIFKRFYKGEGGQHGLGLAIAQKAAHEMGWDIEASNSGRGACFTIRIPLDLQRDEDS